MTMTEHLTCMIIRQKLKSPVSSGACAATYSRALRPPYPAVHGSEHGTCQMYVCACVYVSGRVMLLTSHVVGVDVLQRGCMLRQQSLERGHDTKGAGQDKTRLNMHATHGPASAGSAARALSGLGECPETD